MPGAMAAAALSCLSACAGVTSDKMRWPVGGPVSRGAAMPARESPAAAPPTVLHLHTLGGDEALQTPALRPDDVALRWPVFARGVTSAFGLRMDPIEPQQARFHRGVDLRSRHGALVYAAAPGRVVSGGWLGGHGRHVAIDHGGGLETGYSHLATLLVSDGMWVDEGQPIGLVGESGRTTGPHLHFEVILRGEPLDPLHALGDRLPDENPLDPAPPRLVYPRGNVASLR